jgi:hypothetical protein
VVPLVSPLAQTARRAAVIGLQTPLPRVEPYLYEAEGVRGAQIMLTVLHSAPRSCVVLSTKQAQIIK